MKLRDVWDAARVGIGIVKSVPLWPKIKGALKDESTDQFPDEALRFLNYIERHPDASDAIGTMMTIHVKQFGLPKNLDEFSFLLKKSVTQSYGLAASCEDLEMMAELDVGGRRIKKITDSIDSMRTDSKDLADKFFSRVHMFEFFIRTVVPECDQDIIRNAARNRPSVVLAKQMQSCQP